MNSQVYFLTGQYCNNALLQIGVVGYYCNN